VAKASDLLLIMLDPLKGMEQKKKIHKELDAMGIRINREKPNIAVRRLTTGGVRLNSLTKLTKVINIDISWLILYSSMKKLVRLFVKNTKFTMQKLFAEMMSLWMILLMKSKEIENTLTQYTFTIKLIQLVLRIVMN
jgi:ribosome-interacting GTPase 1